MLAFFRRPKHIYVTPYALMEVADLQTRFGYINIHIHIHIYVNVKSQPLNIRAIVKKKKWFIHIYSFF